MKSVIGVDSLVQYRDGNRKDYKIYLEPLLNTGCKAKGKEYNLSKSEYGRLCVIRCLMLDGFPLNKMTEKFDEYYKMLSFLLDR